MSKKKNKPIRILTIRNEGADEKEWIEYDPIYGTFAWRVITESRKFSSLQEPLIEIGFINPEIIEPDIIAEAYFPCGIKFVDMKFTEAGRVFDKSKFDKIHPGCLEWGGMLV